MADRAPLIVAGAYCLLAVICNLLVWEVSLLTDAPYLSNFDARGYDQLARQLWGDGPIDGPRLSQRGYLFSFVAGGLLIAHPLFLFVAQVISVAAGLWALSEMERVIAGRVRLTPLALLVPSLWLAPSHLMTESFAFGLAAGGGLLLLRMNAWGVVLLGAGALVKPALLIGALAALILSIGRRLAVPVVVLGLLLSPQFWLTSKHGASVTLSTAGVDNFVERFHPAVVGFAETGEIVRYRDPAAQVYRQAASRLEYKIADIAVRPVATLQTWAQILSLDHLWQPSGYLARNLDGLKWSVADPLRTWSLWVNIALSLTLPLGLIGVILFMRQERFALWACAFAGPGLLLLAPLVYWQGDRVVFIGVLLLLPFASLALTRFAQQASD